MAELHAADAGAVRLSRHAVEHMICEIWSGYFGRDVAPYDDFFDLGGDSLAMIDVVGQARDRGLPVRSSVALRNPSPARLAKILTSGDTATTARGWLARPRRSENPRLRMLCFPHVGAGGAAFNSWLDDLPADIDLCAIRLPGRENRLREPLVDDWRELVEGLEPLLAAQLDLPYVLAGHCSGTVLAYELARRLVASGNPAPAMLVLSSTPGPTVRRIDEPLHLLPRGELLTRVIEFGGMAREILDDPELMVMFERILRADYRVIERLEYSPGAPLDVPITVIGGRHDEFVSCQAMAAWAAETTTEFSLHLLDAGHYILTEAGALVAAIMRHLVRQ
jgi:medium-chain acyl-[acyl-carrier-protein] hydrolase